MDTCLIKHMNYTGKILYMMIVYKEIRYFVLLPINKC